MKHFKRLFIIACALSIPALFCADRPSVHGMLIVGTEKIYLSHLPMFHTPHDYQVLLEAQFSESGHEAYLKSFKPHEKVIYTLVPETFVLPEMVNNPRPFKAQVFRGHFERGGTAIAENVTVTIKKVIMFRKFKSGDQRPKDATYVIFGNLKEQFMAHTITKKPDFDGVSKINVNEGVAQLLKTKTLIPMVIEGKSNLKPLEPGVPYEAMLPDENNLKTKLLIESNIYVEFGDLES